MYQTTQANGGAELENAIKYSSHDEPVTITAELKGNFVITSVAQFYRGKDSRHTIPGTRMGLPIANAIITAHGGSLRVRSQWGHGSTFAFSLPIY